MIVSRERETQQNKNIIDAAAKVDTLERFVYSGLPNTNKLSGGKYDVYHFDGKGIAEMYGKLAHPKLWEKTSVLYAGFYLENFSRPIGAMLRPHLVCLQNVYLRVPSLPLGLSQIWRLIEFIGQEQRYSRLVCRRTTSFDAITPVLCHCGYWSTRVRSSQICTWQEA